jgi:hypothetical protein
MAHKRISTITLSLVFGLAALLIILPSKGQVQNPPAKSQRKVFDENRFPIADFLAAEPTDQTERIKRQVRAEKRNKSPWHVNPDTPADNTVLVDFVDPKLPALPFGMSSLVVVGQIKDARAYLSTDKSGVFSSFKVQVNEILKNSSTLPLTTASEIEVEREGGRVRFPSGRLHLFKTSALNMPMVGLRYLLFLENGKEEPVFQIITGYELKDGKVYPLDDLPNSKYHEGATELTFLSEIRILASKP